MEVEGVGEPVLEEKHPSSRSGRRPACEAPPWSPSYLSNEAALRKKASSLYRQEVTALNADGSSRAQIYGCLSMNLLPPPPPPPPCSLSSVSQ